MTPTQQQKRGGITPPSPESLNGSNRIITVDDREGSRDLIHHLQHRGIPVQSGRLEYGDLSFWGHGNTGPVRVGIEYKSIEDLANSMRTGRLSGHQLPGMAQQYRHLFLLIRGVWREGDGGIVECAVRGGWRPLRAGITQFSWREIEGHLNTLELVGGVKVRRAATIHDTVSYITGLYNWFGKPWEDHGSHLTIYADPNPGSAFLFKPTLLRRVAKELPGVGWDKSKKIEDSFESVVDLCCASEKTLMEIEGIGRVTAQRIVRSLNGHKE